MDTPIQTEPNTPRSKFIFPVAIVTIISLTVTLVGGYITEQAVKTRLQDFFNRQADQIANTYYNKLRTQITILEGIRGLYNSTDNFSQEKFNEYLSSYDFNSLDQSGVSTYFYIPVVAPPEIAKFETRLRQEKINDYIYSSFTIHPESDQVFHYPVTYGYPIKGRETSLGLDFATFSERRDAIEYARDQNTLATTKAVTLQTTGKPGFFFLLPLYKSNLPLERTVERRTAFAGVIGAAFRSESAFEQIFGGGNPYPYLDFHIYQGDSTTDDRLLYDSDIPFNSSQPRFETTRKIRLNDQSWTIVVRSKPNFLLGDPEQQLPTLVFAFGLIATFVLAIYASYQISKIRHTR